MKGKPQPDEKVYVQNWYIKMHIYTQQQNAVCLVNAFLSFEFTQRLNTEIE